ncbi:MAG TPA: excinuclease ABC subunit UvrB [Armatimonadota bacterium]|jgi:excinuclease ABC subunit B
MEDRFQIVSDYRPEGDQPKAIAGLVQGVERGDRMQTLVGVTGSGKTFTMANVIQEVQRPTLVIAHNKTLAAQLCSEFREFFPHNAVEYFVSYYDYYQPEAYIPQTDTYIEKDSSINDEIDRLRHAATQAVLERRDVIIVASVSCIYGLGSPDEYMRQILPLRAGQSYHRDPILHQLVEMQFSRNDIALTRGTFRVKGDTLEVHPTDEEVITRLEFFGDELERIRIMDPLTGEVLREQERVTFFPASHFVSSKQTIDRALKQIEQELEEQLAYFNSVNKLLEAQRLEQRTKYDMEMIREVGFCSGIENYSRHMDGREPGTPPNTLLTYFPDDFLCFIDESHVTIPQLNGMYHGDMSRKTTLVDFGFRLPSAKDNRPLRFEEFQERINQVVFVSATPGPFEKANSEQTVEQIIRPTGLLDPEVEIRPTRGQIDDLLGEVRRRAEKGERSLITTLTKRMAEDLTEYLVNLGVRVQYIHSDVQTLERSEILRDLRLGEYDCIVGINLLREGLDLPEVTLVAILDADKEGFLRSETSMIQTMGRAARNVGGRVIMYADRVTDSMKRAMDETLRRRAIQEAYNIEHGIEPATIIKGIRDLLMSDEAGRVSESKAQYSPSLETGVFDQAELPSAIERLKEQMKKASKELRFEDAAAMRDRIKQLEALRDDTLPEADMSAELWGRNKRQRPEGEPQKPDMLTKHKSGGRRKR